MRLTRNGYVFIIFLSSTAPLHAQVSRTQFETDFQSLRVITADPAFNSRIEKVVNRTRLDRCPLLYRVSVNFAFNSTRDSAVYKNVARKADDLANALIAAEQPTEFERDVSALTRSMISTTTDSYSILLVRRAVIDKEEKISEWLRRKLLKALGEQSDILDDTEASMYRLPSDHKNIVKFTSVRTGNDLFTVAGLYDQIFMPKNKFIKDGNRIFQRNDDRDYTGSLLVEIGTDYLNIHGSNPSKSYQTFLYGFDVYTPYFRDTAIFRADTSTNHLDRPHASFQYFGWSRKSLSFNTKVRSSFTIKAGLIGGSAGAKFQNALHRDISYSPRPRGWGAQIANGGRIGFSLEWKAERQERIGDKNFYVSGFFDTKLGTYMTTGGAGLQISNKSFAQCNPNFITLFNRKKSDRFLQVIRQHLMYNVAFTYNRVVHNTMLEGYGVFKTNEEENFEFNLKSHYVMAPNRIRRDTYLLNIALSYSTKYVTYFYNWKSFSPETKNGDIGINSPYSVQLGHPEHMNISHRWHHFAEIGVSFNIL